MLSPDVTTAFKIGFDENVCETNGQTQFQQISFSYLCDKFPDLRNDKIKKRNCGPTAFYRF